MGNTYFNCMKSTSSDSDNQIIYNNNLKVKSYPHSSLNVASTQNITQQYQQHKLQSESQSFINEELTNILTLTNYTISIDSVKKFFLSNSIPNLSIDNFSSLSNQQLQQEEDSINQFTSLISFPKKIKQRTCLIQPIIFNSKNTKNIKESTELFIKAVIATSFNFEFTLHLQGYIEHNDTIFLIYPSITTSLEDLLINDSLDFNNKIIITKNIISALKLLHSNRLFIEEFNAKGIKFTDKRFMLKIIQIALITDDDSLNHYKENIYSLGLILLSLFSNKILYDKSDPSDIGKIENIYLKAFIVGLLRNEENERPSIDDVVKVFNEFIKQCENEHLIMIDNESDISKYQILL